MLKCSMNLKNTNVRLYHSYLHLVAEKYLFSLKEILVSEQHNSALVAQVLWGLLACEILN